MGLSPTISAAIVQRPGFRIGLGISGGFLFYGANYDKTPIFHSGDPKLVRNNVIELDAGAGGDMAWRNRWMYGDIGILTSQLPGNAISSKVATMHFVPHAMVYGGVLFKLAYNLNLGPRILYKNTMFADGQTIRKSQCDIGLKAELDRQNLWFLASYRIDHGGFTAGLGAKIWERDSIMHPELVYLGVNLVAVFNIPGWGNNQLGPTAEIGLGLAIGQRYKVTRIDTLRDVGPIWESGANLTRHKDDRLAPTSPPGIVAGLEPADSHIVITYEFADDSRSYAGERPAFAMDTLLSAVGAEWVGIDNFLENVVHETVEECLSPDLTKVLKLERMDSLKRLMWVQLSTNLKWDRQSAMTGPGVTYNGELNPPWHKLDTLKFKVVYDERDTTVVIPPRNYYLNNFELSALKLFAMRKKLEYELEMYYAAQNRDVVIAWEDEPMPIAWDINSDDTEYRLAPRIFIRKLRIESDHPKQKALELTCVTMKFRKFREGESRVRRYKPRADQVTSDHGDPDAQTTKRKKKKAARQGNSLFERIDFVKDRSTKTPKRDRRGTVPTAPASGGLNH